MYADLSFVAESLGNGHDGNVKFLCNVRECHRHGKENTTALWLWKYRGGAELTSWASDAANPRAENIADGAAVVQKLPATLVSRTAAAFSASRKPESKYGPSESAILRKSLKG